MTLEPSAVWLLALGIVVVGAVAVLCVWLMTKRK
jgi:hypothetical protein